MNLNRYPFYSWLVWLIFGLYISTFVRFFIITLFFLNLKKKKIYVSVRRMVCCSHQSDRLEYVRYLASIRASFCSLVWEVFKFQRSNGGFGESVKWNHLLDEKCWLFCVFNVYFIALYEICDTTGQMKDIKLPLHNKLSYARILIGSHL